MRSARGRWDDLLGELTDRVDVERPTRTADSRGGRTTTWAVVRVAAPCRIEPAGAPERETVDAARIAARNVVTVHLAEWEDVRIGDRLRRGSKVWEVLASAPAATGAPCRAVVAATEAT